MASSKLVQSLAASDVEPRAEVQDLSLSDLVRFVRRHLPLIVTTILICVAVTTAWNLLWVQTRWEASAILVVNRATFSSELTPDPRPAKAYRELLHSAAVIEETEKRLQESTDDLELPLRINSEVIVSGTGTNPMLRLVAQAQDPARASLVANTWANVAVAWTQKLFVQSTLRSVGLVESRYKEASEGLEKLEAEDVRVRSSFQDQSNSLALRWEAKIADARNEGRRRVTAYQLETQELFHQIATRHGLAVEESTDPEVGSGARSDAGRLRQAVALRKDLAQTLPYISLEKGVSDDVFWQWLGDEAVGSEPEIARRLSSLTGLRLQDPEVNPAYLDLQSRRLSIEQEILRQEPSGGTTTTTALLADLEQADLERNAGLTRLLDDVELKLNGLRFSYRTELEALRHQYQQGLFRQRREIDLATGHLVSLANDFEEAKLARAELSSASVTVGILPAIPPRQPLPRFLPMRILMAFAVSLVLGVIIAGVRELLGGRPVWRAQLGEPFSHSDAA